MDRRAFTAGTLGLLVAPAAVWAQSASTVRRIGLLDLGSASEAQEDLTAFRDRLRELGWVEGRSLAIQTRWADDEPDRLPALAAELVRLNVDVIVTITTPAAGAAKAATSTIPIVMAGSAYPVKLGLVASLARPGGNVTGVTNNPEPEFIGKQLQLLRDAAPRVARVAVLTNPAIEPEALAVHAMRDAVRALGLTLLAVEVTSAEHFDVTRLAEARPDALYVFPNSINWAHRQAITDFASQHRLPTMYGDKASVRAGGLMSYWTDWLDLRRRAAVYVDKILKGAKPADLPVEEPTKFELVINLKTAKALGLTILPSVLARADEVIE
jgi:putative tryptophan/tyrosine transport system substrate-binding protein